MIISRPTPPPRLVETVEGDPVDDWVNPSHSLWAPETPDTLPADDD
nr:hypothetical protein [Brevundimonas diminuta]